MNIHCRAPGSSNRHHMATGSPNSDCTTVGSANGQRTGSANGQPRLRLRRSAAVGEHGKEARPLEIHRSCKRSGRCKPSLLTSPERESPEAWRPRVPSGRGRGRLLRTRTLGSASPSSVAPATDPSSGAAVSRRLRGGGSAQVRPGLSGGQGRAGRRDSSPQGARGAEPEPPPLPPSHPRPSCALASEGRRGEPAGRPGVRSSGPGAAGRGEAGVAEERCAWRGCRAIAARAAAPRGGPSPSPAPAVHAQVHLGTMEMRVCELRVPAFRAVFCVK